MEYVECGLCNSYRAQTGSAIGISRFHQSSYLGAVSASRMQGERPIGPYLANEICNQLKFICKLPNFVHLFWPFSVLPTKDILLGTSIIRDGLR